MKAVHTYQSRFLLKAIFGILCLLLVLLVSRPALAADSTKPTLVDSCKVSEDGKQITFITTVTVPAKGKEFTLQDYQFYIGDTQDSYNFGFSKGDPATLTIAATSLSQDRKYEFNVSSTKQTIADAGGENQITIKKATDDEGTADEQRTFLVSGMNIALEPQDSITISLTVGINNLGDYSSLTGIYSSTVGGLSAGTGAEVDGGDVGEKIYFVVAPGVTVSDEDPENVLTAIPAVLSWNDVSAKHAITKDKTLSINDQDQELPLTFWYKYPVSGQLKYTIKQNGSQVTSEVLPATDADSAFHEAAVTIPQQYLQKAENQFTVEIGQANGSQVMDTLTLTVANAASTEQPSTNASEEQSIGTFHVTADPNALPVLLETPAAFAFTSTLKADGSYQLTAEEQGEFSIVSGNASTSWQLSARLLSAKGTANQLTNQRTQKELTITSFSMNGKNIVQTGTGATIWEMANQAGEQKTTMKPTIGFYAPDLQADDELSGVIEYSLNTVPDIP